MTLFPSEDVVTLAYMTAEKWISFRVDRDTLGRVNELAARVGGRTRLLMLALGLADGLMTMDDLVMNGGATGADPRVQRVRGNVVAIVEALAPGLPAQTEPSEDEAPLP